MATEQELHLAEKIIVAILPEILDFIATLAEMPLTEELTGDISSDDMLDCQIMTAREIGQRIKKLYEESK